MEAIQGGGDFNECIPTTQLGSGAVNLMKLTLSHINLSSDEIIEKLCNVIFEKKKVSHLDISWTCLKPKQMARISEALKTSNSIRHLNLSFNSLTYPKLIKNANGEELNEDEMKHNQMHNQRAEV